MAKEKITKSKILPVDDLSEMKEQGEKAQAKVKKSKVKKQEEKKEEATTVTREKITPQTDAAEKAEDKGKEFPEFELAFDPFADQSK